MMGMKLSGNHAELEREYVAPDRRSCDQSGSKNCKKEVKHLCQTSAQQNFPPRNSSSVAAAAGQHLQRHRQRIVLLEPDKGNQNGGAPITQEF